MHCALVLARLALSKGNFLDPPLVWCRPFDLPPEGGTSCCEVGTAQPEIHNWQC